VFEAEHVEEGYLDDYSVPQLGVLGELDLCSVLFRGTPPFPCLMCAKS